MTKLLLKLFVKDYKNTQSDVVRARYGNLASVTCILLNILLATGKIVSGILFGAISVMVDGFNNLTDCGSNVVSLISFKMANKPADKEHPFGHQRIEYISALIVGIIVIMLAIELATQSFDKIINPQTAQFSLIAIIVMCVSIVVKLWMFLFNRKLGKAINSSVLKATALDSITDCIATSAVIVALLVSNWVGFNLDGYMGIVVAIVIGIAGIKIIRETMSKLLGQAPSEDVIDQIKQRIAKFPQVIAVHDLMVHSYGYSKLYASVHVEVDSNMSTMDTHDLADNIERDFQQNTDITMVVHIDPVVTDDPEVDRLKQLTVDVVSGIAEELTVHDFRVVKGVTHTNLIFDIAIPYECKLDEKQIKDQIVAKISATDSKLYVVAHLERQ